MTLLISLNIMYCQTILHITQIKYKFTATNPIMNYAVYRVTQRTKFKQQ